MKSARFNKEYRENASSLHKIVGDILLYGNTFKLYKIYQEYPVKAINPDFYNPQCKYDWVILDLKIVIEIMGEQHYKPVRWSRDITVGEAEMNFQDTQRKDEQKKNAALEVGFSYVALDFKTVRERNFNEGRLLQIIKDNLNTTEDYHNFSMETEKRKTQNPLWLKEKRREISRQNYRRAKEWVRKIQEEQHK